MRPFVTPFVPFCLVVGLENSTGLTAEGLAALKPGCPARGPECWVTGSHSFHRFTGLSAFGCFGLADFKGLQVQMMSTVELLLPALSSSTPRSSGTLGCLRV